MLGEAKNLCGKFILVLLIFVLSFCTNDRQTFNYSINENIVHAERSKLISAWDVISASGDSVVQKNFAMLRVVESSLINDTIFIKARGRIKTGFYEVFEMKISKDRKVDAQIYIYCQGDSGIYREREVLFNSLELNNVPDYNNDTIYGRLSAKYTLEQNGSIISGTINGDLLIGKGTQEKEKEL